VEFLPVEPAQSGKKTTDSGQTSHQQEQQFCRLWVSSSKFLLIMVVTVLCTTKKEKLMLAIPVTLQVRYRAEVKTIRAIILRQVSIDPGGYGVE
jgi:hypothetical protein